MDIRRRSAAVQPAAEKRVVGLPSSDCVIYQDLFDGEEWELEIGDDFGPATWYVDDGEWVGVEGSETDKLEGPDVNWVLREPADWERRSADVEGGWSKCAVMLQTLASVLGGKAHCAQINTRNSKEAAFGPPDAVRYTFRYEAGRGATLD